jgi:lysophospholipase L1-like esterase
MLGIGADAFVGNPKSYAQGIRALLDAYEKNTHAHIALMGILPRGATPADPGRVWAKNVNAIISTYSSDPRVSYIDIGDKFLMPDGTLAKDMFFDPLHPSPKGFETWAQAVQPMVDQYVSSAAK